MASMEIVSDVEMAELGLPTPATLTSSSIDHWTVLNRTGEILNYSSNWKVAIGIHSKNRRFTRQLNGIVSSSFFPTPGCLPSVKSVLISVLNNLWRHQEELFDEILSLETHSCHPSAWLRRYIHVIKSSTGWPYGIWRRVSCLPTSSPTLLQWTRRIRNPYGPGLAWCCSLLPWSFGSGPLI